GPSGGSVTGQGQLPCNPSVMSGQHQATQQHHQQMPNSIPGVGPGGGPTRVMGPQYSAGPMVANQQVAGGASAMMGPRMQPSAGAQQAASSQMNIGELVF